MLSQRERTISSRSFKTKFYALAMEPPPNKLLLSLIHRVLSIMPKILEISVGIQMKGPFQFLPSEIFGITSGGGPLISVGIFRSNFDKPVLIREFGKDKKW